MFPSHNPGQTKYSSQLTDINISPVRLHIHWRDLSRFPSYYFAEISQYLPPTPLPPSPDTYLESWRGLVTAGFHTASQAGTVSGVNGVNGV